PVEMIVVRVPAAIELAELVPDHRDKPASRLHQPARLQHALPEQRQPVGLANAVRLSAQVEGGPYLRRIDERKRQLALPIHAANSNTLIQRLARLIEFLQQR